MVKKFVENPERKLTKQPSKRVKEVACQEPKPLQEKSSLKEAGEKPWVFDGEAFIRPGMKDTG